MLSPSFIMAMNELVKGNRVMHPCDEYIYPGYYTVYEFQGDALYTTTYDDGVIDDEHWKFSRESFSKSDMTSPSWRKYPCS